MDLDANIERHISFTNYQYHGEVYLRYMTLQLYRESGTTILLVLEAPTVRQGGCPESLQALLHGFWSLVSGLYRLCMQAAQAGHPVRPNFNDP